jgi:hypothetical protein
MAEITFVIPARNLDALHRTLSMLSFQKGGRLRAVVVDLAGSEAVRSVIPDFENHFPVSAISVEQAGQPLWKCCLDAVPEAEWVCFLTPGVDLNETSVKRMCRCIDGHDGYDVFHWNLAEPNKKWRLRTRPDRIFTTVFVDGGAAPLSSFVFRAQALREAFEADSEAAGMASAIILAAAKKSGIRTARRERIGYTAPAPSTDPSVVEREVRARLAFFRWSERYFGEEYPLGVSDRLALFAGELARLYPSFTPDELKEDLNTFACVNGPIRRMKASSALKSALKARQEALSTPPAEK